MGKRRLRIFLVALVGAGIGILGGAVPAHASGASVNNLSLQGSMDRIRARPVFQDTTGGTILQQGDPTKSSTNPNRTIGDDVAPTTFNVSGPRLTGSNPFGGDGHTHYHAGDTAIVVDDVTGFALGDTIQIGSSGCNMAFLDITCKKSLPATNEQPFGQVVHIIGGDVGPGYAGPGLIQFTPPLVNSPRCFTASYGACAFVEAEPVMKLPTLYQGQQFRVDIPHADILYGSPNNVIVTADFIAPQGAHDANYPRRPLTLSRDTTSTSAIVSSTCPCGAGFVSFYVPKEITGTATIGQTFSVDTPDTWYSIYVKAVDAINPAIIRSDGVYRFKLNPVAIVDFTPDRDPIFVTEAVTVSGKLRDNSSPQGLQNLPVEDVIVDVDVTHPSGVTSHYQTTSCVDINPTATDYCQSNPFGAPGNQHGAFAAKIGGLQGLFVGFPNVFTSTLNCQGKVNIFVPTTYVNALNIPGCVVAPFLSAVDTLEPGTYNATASLRGYIPAVSAGTSFDVLLL